MSDCLKELEYYSFIHNCYVYGEIIGIQEDNCYVLKNQKDGTEEICEANNIRKITKVSSNSLDDGQWEYIKGDDEFLDVNLKEQKGLFYIIELIDEDGNSSTRLARQKELRCINYIPINDFLEDKYSNIYFEIPPEISSWIDSDKYKEIIGQMGKLISNDHENSELFIVSYQDDDDSLKLRVLCNSEKKDLAKLFLDKAIEKEKKLSSVNRDKENSKKELEDVKKKNKTLFIPQKYVGLIIGKDGINVKNLKNKYGVNIKIDSKKVNEKSSKIIITGENGENVEECSKEIDIVQKIYEISEKCSIDIKKRANNLMESYKIKMIYVSNEEKKDDNGNTYKAPNVEIIGNEEYIEDFYNKEIKDFDKYSYDNQYNNNYSGSSYRQNNRRHNNYYGYQNNYKSYKGYNSYNNYYQ